MRALIVDDHLLFAEAIQLTLEDYGIEVVGTAGTANDGLEASDRLEPDVVLLDLFLPDEDGIVVGKRMLERHPQMKVIALTASDDPDAVKDALKCGFSGYITKSISLSRLFDAIQSALNGQVVIPQRSARAVGGAPSPESAQVELLIRQLTPREKDVLRLLVKGASSLEIARELSVSPNTVRSHVQNVLTKLQVHSRLEAAAFAVQNGVVKVPGYAAAV